ncbi:hypothetical protein AB1K18_24235 [Peribacillus simplex]|uniref:hypothetical protein n=1 Tax=Peribacillus simplex TaxID=1478 RepID=UPI003B8D00E0
MGGGRFIGVEVDLSARKVDLFGWRSIYLGGGRILATQPKKALAVNSRQALVYLVS